MGIIKDSIVLTGGPKAGKSSTKELIKSHIESKYGYQVFVIPETATEIISGGCIPQGNKDSQRKIFEETLIAFQKAIFRLQYAKEKTYKRLASEWLIDSIIVYDRALIDGFGYLLMHLGEEGRTIFNDLLKEVNLTIQDVFNWYGLVLSLETSAYIIDFDKQAGDDKTKRIEAGGDEAMLVDKNVTKAYEGHPNIIRIPAKKDFCEKQNLIIGAIDQRLDNPVKKLIR